MPRKLQTAIAIGAAAALLTACGSSEAASKSEKSGKPSTASTPSLGTQACDAYLRSTRDEKQPSKQAAAMLAELAKLRVAASDRAGLRELVASFRAVEAAWTSTAPTTPDAFITQSRAASEKFSAAAQATKLDPCPRADSTAPTTTTTAGAAKPTWAFNTVDLPTDGDGLWVYFDASCPEGSTLAGVTDPWRANPGVANSFAALVPGLVAGQPFSGGVADAAFAARPDFSGTCAPNAP